MLSINHTFKISIYNKQSISTDIHRSTKSTFGHALRIICGRKTNPERENSIEPKHQPIKDVRTNTYELSLIVGHFHHWTDTSAVCKTDQTAFGKLLLSACWQEGNGTWPEITPALNTAHADVIEMQMQRMCIENAWHWTCRSPQNSTVRYQGNNRLCAFFL